MYETAARMFGHPESCRVMDDCVAQTSKPPKQLCISGIDSRPWYVNVAGQVQATETATLGT
jgi:hypothetical protein